MQSVYIDISSASNSSVDGIVSSSFAMAPTSCLDPVDVGRRRNDSETGSVFGGGWGDIHFGDATHSANASNSDVILDISADIGNAGGLGGSANGFSGGLVAEASSNAGTLSTCLEEIALND